MSSPEIRTRRPAELALTIGVFVAVFASLLPLLRVVESGSWVPGAVVLSAIILAIGYICRWFRLPAVAVSLVEAVVWVVIVTVSFLRDTALFGLIPTPESVRRVPDLLRSAFDAIVQGAAPLPPEAGLTFFIVAAMGLLTIVIDHVVLTARMPLLAAVGLIAISLIPSIAVPGPINVVAFVLLAVAILFLLRIEVRSRHRSKAAPQTSRSVAGGVGATAIGIGAIGVVVALVATPLLPAPVTAGGVGNGIGASIDPTLSLGDDLRRPADVDVLRVRTSAPSAPYLRAVTLSTFDGDVWQPDRSRTLPLGDADSLGPVTVDDGITLTENSTLVEVQNLVTPWLPVAFPAVEVTGLNGDWGAVPANRTVVSRDGSSQGQQYRIVTDQPRPTLEQIRARSADGAGLGPELLALPADLPPVIAQTAAEVTGASSSDYDKLHDLQSWFRGSDFRYSLEAPVEEGFDGSGADAVADFLDVKEGYCVHYASAFALMARTLGMPSRIVVGYLPGTSTGEMQEKQTVYTVQSGQLHAWPEVFFGGVGWVQFEPTNSLGVPTNFASETLATGNPGETPETAPEPAASASPLSTIDPLDDGLPSGDVQAGATRSATAAVPTVSLVLGILLALAIPAILRVLLRRRLVASARKGDAAAAWRSIQDQALDLGIAVPASESARLLGARLVAEHGAPSDAMSVLVQAIERASYAPGHRLHPERGQEMTDAAAAVRGSMLRSVAPARRLLAVAAPRSLVVRPGSVYAGTVQAGSR
ncbi:Protein-glutamine gamma-glutamyltransferase [Microbacterium lemovicicum]|uniref:Protein-glutamine gamma-glutamyltransferase n=1 Tax=Microbacterium lemovicicum TaxID=1072463 RepID=A0A3Q9IZD9_9MICO|nr:DUF3488 and transglutaminase-like domain-containing protein [Microbacterium lemovicicum]AZS37720.1 Protein-glutamine gamma-glutamyltransferase [Microbacterium lemovicicum]